MKNASNTRDYIVSIDAGTQSIRAALVNAEGEIAHIVKTPIQPYFSERPGWAEQKPEYYWNTLGNTCKALLRNASVPKESLVAVALATQRATVINVDAGGHPLRPAIVWLDQRKADSSGILPAWIKALLTVVGLADRIEWAIQSCEANWIRQNQPQIWQKTHKYLLLSGYFHYRLTGEFVDSTGNTVGYFPTNSRTHEWAGKHDFKWWLFQIEKEKLPRLVKPAEVLGQVTRKAAAETDLPQGLPVIAAGTDKGCEVLGAGCLTPDTGCLSFGTTATFNTMTRKYVELIPFIPPYPASIPDLHYTEAEVFRGFWMVRWFKEQFGSAEITQAEARKVAPEKIFDELIEKVPAGSMGLILQPYWSPGPGLESYTKGSIVGFGDIHDRGYLYRAILEGIAYALRDGAERTQKKTHIPIKRLIVSGGGSQSDMAMQITADVFGMPTERPHTFETSALGAAIDAAVGLRMYDSFSDAVKSMVRVKQVFEPVPDRYRLYDELYRHVYKHVYRRLKPLYKKIWTITGYPE